MILVDSPVFMAFADARDQWHGAAKDLFPFRITDIAHTGAILSPGSGFDAIKLKSHF